MAVFGLKNRLWAGAAAGAAAFSFYGDQDTPFGERALTGAAAGATLGVAVPGLLGAFKGGSSLAAQGIRGYGRSMSANYSSLVKEGLPAWKSAFAAYGRMPMMAAGGAALGAMIDRDDPGKGALIGAAAGAGTRLAFQGYQAWRNITHPTVFGLLKQNSAVSKTLGKGSKLAVIGGLSALAFGIGSSMADKGVSAEGVSNAAGGYDEYAPGTAPGGVKDRLNRLNASGSMVLGAHNRRHG